MAPSTEGQQTFDLMVVRGRQDLKIQGPRLNQTKEDKMLVRHGPDRRLDPIITPPMPLMEITLPPLSSYEVIGCCVTVFICASRSLSVQAVACRSSVPPHQSQDDKGSGGTLVFIDVENINTSEAGCVSSTSSRCPAAVSTGASTSVSTQPRIKTVNSPAEKEPSCVSGPHDAGPTKIPRMPWKNTPLQT
ncbi:trafficking protein particle complex subunit 8-like [Micropterus salmoides]|uniref:trafficking protein particle complex subunit 8-like n=1 Tax=Micropterus salmoides TaxID=27706 RepID=UPI0018EAB0A2|nr:trafficking protein particle complex subunit 8-like [Micropterus salmoides]